MPNIRYAAAMLRDDAGVIVEQITTLVDGTDEEAMRRIQGKVDELGWDLEEYQLLVWESDTYGEERMPDGKDVYRLHHALN